MQRENRYDWGRQLRLEQIVAELGASLLAAPPERSVAIVERGLGELADWLRVDTARLGEMPRHGIDVRPVACSGSDRGRDRPADWPRFGAMREVLRDAGVIGRCAPGQPLSSGELRGWGTSRLPEAYLLVSAALPDASDAVLFLASDRNSVVWPEELVPRLQLLTRIAVCGLQRQRRAEFIEAAGSQLRRENRSLRTQIAAPRGIRVPYHGAGSLGPTSVSRRPPLHWVMGTSKPVL